MLLLVWSALSIVVVASTTTADNRAERLTRALYTDVGATNRRPHRHQGDSSAWLSLTPSADAVPEPQVQDGLPSTFNASINVYFARVRHTLLQEVRSQRAHHLAARARAYN